MQLDPADIDVICDLIQQLCGLYLDKGKGYLIEARLAEIAKRHNCTSYRQLADRAKSAVAPTLQREIIDAITTQETLFFRDGSPFDALRFKTIPELIDEKSKSMNPRRIRIWSAACSTGQEPYSLSILLHELIPDIAKWDIQITATDISDSALAKASRGWYSALEVDRGLVATTRSKFFTEENAGWKVSDSVRSLVAFKRLNLMEPFNHLGPFDIVFCRNVAIYFPGPKRTDLFRRIKSVLTPTGYLFVGASETLIDIGPEFRPMIHCRSVFYRPNMPTTTAPIAPAAATIKPATASPTVRR